MQGQIITFKMCQERCRVKPSNLQVRIYDKKRIDFLQLF